MSRLLPILSLIAALAGCAWTEPFPTQTLRVEVAEKDVVCRLSNDRGTWTMVAPGSVDVLESTTPLAVSCNKPGKPAGHVQLIARPSSLMPRVMMEGGARALTDPRGYAPHRYPSVVRVTLGQSLTQDL